MSTYLVAFVIGEYDFVESQSSDGVTVRVYTPVGKAEQGKFALEVRLSLFHSLMRLSLCDSFLCFIFYSSVFIFVRLQLKHYHSTKNTSVFPILCLRLIS